MKENTSRILEDFRWENPDLKGSMKQIEKSVEMLIACYKNGGKVLVCGNGGSASDSEHIVGELMKGFCNRRPLTEEQRERIAQVSKDEKEADYLGDYLQGTLPAISLVSHSALISAFSNDVQPDMVYAQQVFGYGKEGDVLMCLSTSGNSKNVVYAAKIARANGLGVISFTRREGSQLSRISHVTLKSTQEETYRVQEEHIKFYHLICLAVENEFFG